MKILLLILFLSFDSFGSWRCHFKFAQVSEGGADIEAAVQTYQSIWNEIGNTITAETFQKMILSRNPFQLPEGVSTQSDSLNSTLREFKSMIKISGLKESEVQKALLEYLKSRVLGVKEVDKRAEVIRKKDLIDSTMVWSSDPNYISNASHNAQFFIAMMNFAALLEVQTPNGQKVTHDLSKVVNSVIGVAVSNNGKLYVSADKKIWVADLANEKGGLNKSISLTLWLDNSQNKIIKNKDMINLELSPDDKYLKGNYALEHFTVVPVDATELILTKQAEYGLPFYYEIKQGRIIGLSKNNNAKSVATTGSRESTSVEFQVLYLDTTGKKANEDFIWTTDFPSEFNARSSFNLRSTTKTNIFRSIITKYNSSGEDARPVLVEFDLKSKKGTIVPLKGALESLVSHVDGVFYEADLLKAPGKALIYQYNSTTQRKIYYILDINTAHTEFLDIEKAFEGEGIRSHLKIPEDKYPILKHSFPGTNLIALQSPDRYRLKILDLTDYLPKN